MSTNTRTVVVALAIVLVLAVLGIVVLAALKIPNPEVLTTIAVGDLTGLLGLLVPREAPSAVSAPQA